MRWYLLSFFAVLGVHPTLAAAEVWQPRLSIGSDFPVAASGRASLLTPIGLELGASIGTLPGAYADVINDFAVSSGGYDEDTAEVVRQSLRSSLVVSTFAGMDVVSRLRLHADYTLVTLGGATTTPEITASVAGVPLPFGEDSRDVEISSTLHMLGFGMSWPIQMGPSLQLRLGLGGRFTRSASTTVQSSGNSSQEEDYERQAERRLNEIYTKYAHTPVVSAHLEYSF